MRGRNNNFCQCSKEIIDKVSLGDQTTKNIQFNR